MVGINFLVFLGNKRLYVLYGIIFSACFILSVRLIYLQIVCSDYLIAEGDKRSMRIQNIPESRGLIMDRMGRLLAINILMYSIWIDPHQINKCGGVYSNIFKWTTLSDILHIPLERLFFFINSHSTEHFIYLSRQVNSVIAKKVNQLHLSGVYTQQEFKRYYPAGSTAAHLIGITDIDNHGIEGIEKSFDILLSGCPKTRVVRQDRLGQVIEDIDLLHPGRTSKNIMLSIDERLQYLAYHELNKAVNINKAESGSIVLVNINTGEILAMVNSPSYDPNHFSIKDKSVMRNRAITDIFEPGSTIKPIVIMTALQNKVIHKDAIINTLPYMIHGHKIKDVSYHHQLTISEILRKSSNIGVSKLALAMPVSILLNSYVNFGMGQLTNIGLIGENKGKIYSYNRYDSEMEHAALSYGYGLMLTPIQLAKIYSIIGGMGVSRPLSIIKIDQPISLLIPKKRIFSESLIRTVLNMMEITTVSNSGCYQAAITGYRVAVKTGTIKKVGTDGKYINRYIACTAGVAPASDPKFALVVVINDPKNGYYYGSKVSAPVFKSVMSDTLRIMNINPDFSQ